MAFALTTGTQGIPLNIINTSDYETWLSAQPGAVQNWLRSTDYRGEGLRLIAGDDGALNQVVFGAENTQDHFLCGDLVAQLPVADYQFQGDDNLLPLVAFSWGLGAYRFDHYQQDAKKPQPQLVLPSQTLLENTEKHLQAIALVRDLINTPAAEMMPEHLGEAVETLSREFDAEVSQIVGDDLLDQNYPTIHAVGRASAHAPRLIDLRWGDPTHPKITLVGKGVCFDTGGLNLKPTPGIRLMKKDMGGAAHVIGLARLILSHQLPVRLRVLIPAVENAVSGNAFRPGDVLRTRKGLSVEIDNTDAEGRLVLCDALAEAETEKPELLIDFATLTGACRIALGAELPGFYTNTEALAVELMAASKTVDDPLWQMPLHQPYKAFLKSEIADMVNSAATPLGGSITAALYLQAFVGADTPWLHFDVMAWNDRKRPGRPVGGEACGLRAVFEYLQRQYGDGA
jgi:leucyl aminopeptidase